eukprot:jgi/Ulvmu1/2364/UM013_0212.1
MRHCAPAAHVQRSSLLCLLVAAATAQACDFFTHERSILSDLPFSRFTMDDKGQLNPSQSLLTCAQHAAAFEVSAASIELVEGGATVCTLYDVVPEECPSFEDRNSSTAATAVSRCSASAVADIVAAATAIPPAASPQVFGEAATGAAVSAQRYPAAAAVGGVLRGRLQARSAAECLDLCARSVKMCDTVGVDPLTRKSANVVMCSLHAASRAQALTSPGFDMYVGVKNEAPAPAPAAASGSMQAGAPADAADPGLGNLDQALEAAAGKPSEAPPTGLTIG